MLHLTGLVRTISLFSGPAIAPKTLPHLLEDSKLQEFAKLVDLGSARCEQTRLAGIKFAESPKGIDQLEQVFDSSISHVKFKILFNSQQQKFAVGLLIIRNNFPSSDQPTLAFSDVEFLSLVMRRFRLDSEQVLKHCRPQLEAMLENFANLYGSDTQSTRNMFRLFPGLQKTTSAATLS